ncbi:acyl-CoA-binding domain-containing protein 5-like isoform X2 [Stylophora pistillata]|uniref:acyl-CoA-binding domain-containing protein 5-like isoform X2 n=1 Tax=Stylophora pistillata TaxID=50429 RepID=UPI000C05460C|nr:acyl-CoA-binding domain-containing protein 5-like isoform X2 [Stylophora pistillata]
MADCVETRFDAAVNVVRSMPKKGSYKPSYETMLKFYALYKQAKEGQCFESKPGIWEFVNKAKWEAWHGLGKMSKQEAMESYVCELKQVMENLPESEEAADFSEVLKTFYQAVYEGQEEKPPAILKIFEKENVPEKIKAKGKLKSNSHHTLQDKNVLNGYGNTHKVNGTCEEFPCGVNGFPHKDSMDMESQFPHRDSLEISKKASMDLKRRLQFSKAVNPVLIISSDELKECDEEDENDDNDSGIQNGMFEVPPLRPSDTEPTRPKGKSGVVLTSDESEEDEFCDSLDPEHLQELQNGNHVESELPDLDDAFKRVDLTKSKSPNGSPEHATSSTMSESENSDLESGALRFGDLELLTSTPFAKHVTFAMDDTESSTATVVNSDSSRVEPSVTAEECVSEVSPVLENGLGQTSAVGQEYESFQPFDQAPKNPSGILKSHYSVRECGGGDASQQPSGRGHGGRTRQSQGTRTKEGSSSGSGVSHPSRRHRRRSDSDSEDELTSDHTSGPDYDSAGDRDEINERILQALERLHQDMKSVLRRLNTMEEAVLSRQDLVARSEQPWWKSYIPSKPLMFLVLWPFIVNIVFYYFRQRKSSQQR